MAANEEVTAALQRLREGDAAAGEQLFPVVYGELRELARRAMAKQPPGHTLQTTALLNEAWLRLGDGDAGEYRGREHFLAVAATAMRQILVDRARRRGAEKRGGGALRRELDAVVDRLEENAGDLLALDEALETLAKLDPELGRIVELRFFGGMKHPQIAKALDVPLRRVERGWSTARAWLHAQLSEEA